MFSWTAYVVFLSIFLAVNSEPEQLDYKSYNEISKCLKEIAQKYPKLASIFTIGHSFEGRPIQGLKLSTDNLTKPAVLLDAGIHSREWIAPVVALQTAQDLLSKPNLNILLAKVNWYILPMLNPDGYVYSMDSIKGRLWRKNRARTTNPKCDGVDLNRNFGFYWGGLGSSDDPCSEIYRGPYPYSEPETQALANFMLAKQKEIKAYLTLHSAAQALIYPYGYDNYVPLDWQELESLGKKASLEMARINGTKYVVGPTTNLVGAGAGGSDDWAKGYLGIKYVFTVELAGPSYPSEGFNPPRSALPNLVEESIAGIRVIAEHLVQNKTSNLI